MARILIPGPATDPQLRICGPGACLKARTTGLYQLFLRNNGLFLDLNFTLKDMLPGDFEGGELREIWIKTRKIVGTAF